MSDPEQGHPRVETSAPRPFEVAVAPEVLDDLAQRLARARVAPAPAADDGGYGLAAATLQGLVDRWVHGYDWATQEKAINQLDHFTVRIDGVPLHYVHARGEGPDPIPVILTHGWPGSFWDFRDVIPRLTRPSEFGRPGERAFDVVAPSLPGFDFSGPPPGAVGYLQTADLWTRLMVDVLGYESFAAHGYDWGGSVTAQLGHRHSDHVFGVHLASPLTLGAWHTERPHAEMLGGVLSAAGPDTMTRAQALAWEKARAAHLTVHLLDPQTLAHGLHDSPVALLAWLAHRRLSWADPDIVGNAAVDPDDIITLAMLSWVTGTAGSSIRFYRDATRTPWVPVHDRRPVVEPPAGLSLFRPDLPPGFDHTRLAGHYDLVDVTEHAHGGHFPSLEAPEALAEDIRRALTEADRRRRG